MNATSDQAVSETRLSDAVDRGITVTEMTPMDRSIDVSPNTTAAFVGRALRGPLNTPVLVNDFGEFRKRFGDVWTRSSLGPAVRQFFEHGGERLCVVRVANNARGAMLCVPAGGSALVLRAVEPGSSECIRAAVDYDGIDEDDDELFNLTLQRVDLRSAHVIDQELWQRVSFREESAKFVADMLLTSTLARVEHPYPTHRPEATLERSSPFDSAYVGHAQEGADGLELSDYDLIGSRRELTGLFALDQVDRIDILYLPPPGKGRDLGPACVLAAEIYCRERGAMLVADPASDWVTPAKAVAGVRAAGLASPNVLSYFPRMYERNDEGSAPRAVGGAIAGLLCKLDRTHGPWAELDQHGMGFTRKLVAAFDLIDDDVHMLAREGLNLISKGPAGCARMTGSVTLGRGSELHREFAKLSVRRLCLHLVNTIDHATRWAVFEPEGAAVGARIKSVVTAYLAALASFGAFENDRFVVECDANLCHRDDRREHGVTIVVIFHPRGCTEPVSFTLHQSAAGCRVTSTAFAPPLWMCA